ncbi:MAG: zinc ABC transporter substrate-binding protein [Roseovarius sp.]|nr:zinc ABC transporter substrate-binding protein [Roseovarius sp.]MCY4291018.1 zinc ABC transporter substrate-binding protein [Roseovarius sp.]MCY4317348.1 zinc ABC transporter substrate-binding protein [Roseovarius sp.]
MTSRRSLLGSASIAAAFCMAQPIAALSDEPVPVVATFSIIGDMVERIGGAHVALTTLVGPNGDAHVYQPTPQAARAVAEADILFMNGLEFEGWLERLAEAADFKGSTVTVTTGIEPIAFDEDDHEEHEEHEKHGHEEEHDHDHEEEHAEAEHHDHGHEKEHAEINEHDEHGHEHHGHDHGAYDPHAWHSIENAVVYVDNITAGLAEADPANAGDYHANRASYVNELNALATEVKAMMESVRDDKRTVVTSHDAFGYFADAYGLSFTAPQGLSTESEVSAADVSRLITQIREEKISAVFVESITDNRILEQIANETGAAIGGTLYSDALSDKDGPASTYIDMIRHNATTISQALSR